MQILAVDKDETALKAAALRVRKLGFEERVRFLVSPIAKLNNLGVELARAFPDQVSARSCAARDHQYAAGGGVRDAGCVYGTYAPLN